MERTIDLTDYPNVLENSIPHPWTSELSKLCRENPDIAFIDQTDRFLTKRGAQCIRSGRFDKNGEYPFEWEIWRLPNGDYLKALYDSLMQGDVPPVLTEDWIDPIQA